MSALPSIGSDPHPQRKRPSQIATDRVADLADMVRGLLPDAGQISMIFVLDALRVAYMRGETDTLERVRSQIEE